MIKSSIADGAFDITPHNTNDLPITAAGVNVQGAGTLHYIAANGMEHTVTLAAGQTWPVAMTKVFVTGTTCTGIVGFVIGRGF